MRVFGSGKGNEILDFMTEPDAIWAEALEALEYALYVHVQYVFYVWEEH